jgi:hypothetical protein
LTKRINWSRNSSTERLPYTIREATTGLLAKVGGTAHKGHYVGITEEGEQKGLTVNDVRIFWRKSYYYSAVDDTQGQQMIDFLVQCDNDVEGPLLRIDLAMIEPVVDEGIAHLSLLPCWERCRNYPADICWNALQTCQNNQGPGNLTQETMDFGFSDVMGDIIEESNNATMNGQVALNAFEEWSPIFKEVVDFTNASGNKEIIAEGTKVMDWFRTHMLALICEKMPPPSHQDISLCASQSTLHKTHGTSHYKRN